MDRSILALGFIVDAYTHSKTNVQTILTLQAGKFNKHKFLGKENNTQLPHSTCHNHLFLVTKK
jgi:hypothetical protein